jgi:hypothetical protein
LDQRDVRHPKIHRVVGLHPYLLGILSDGFG